MKLSLRSAEWLLVIYFGYVAAIAPRFPLREQIVWRPFLVELLVCALFLALAYGESSEHATVFSMLRDWASVAVLLLAYREMDWFSAMPRNFDLELRWVAWDRTILYQWGGLRAIESLGALGPMFLELCYLLVYAVAPFVVAVFWFQHRRERVNGALFLYLLGTLLAYALFPWLFPSDPPRHRVWRQRHAKHPDIGASSKYVADGKLRNSLQRVSERVRIFGVFRPPGRFSLFFPESKRYGWGMLVYAVCVAIATVYGRYHYAADAVAGMALSLVPGSILLLARRLRVRGLLELP